jgi:hypothetical protein
MKLMRIAVLGLAVTLVLLTDGAPTRATDWCLGGICQEWLARYDGPTNGTDEAYAIAVDGTGNVYVTGQSQGVGTDWDYATIKYDANGNKEWEARYNGPDDGTDQAQAIAVDGAGNVYVTGQSQGVGTGPDYATVKYLSDGTEDWVARYDEASGADQAVAIAVDGGYVYVTGESEGVGTSYDYATVKYDATTGSEVWLTPARYDGPASGLDAANAIGVDGSGNVYVTGKSEGVATGPDYATIKYDATNGSEAWLTPARYDGPAGGTDAAYAMAVDADANVYVTGASAGIGTGADYATIKYDATTGSEVWLAAARYDEASDSDAASAIAVDAGYVYVTGESEGIATGSDYATIKYDATNGSEAWLTPARYDGPASGSDGAYAVGVDGSGNVYVTGESAGSDDYATVKYLSDGTEDWLTRYDGPANGLDAAYAMTVDTAGNVYVTGESQGSGTAADYATIKYMADSDVDGFSDAREVYLGTDPFDNCPGPGLDAWPLDLNNDTLISLFDMLVIRPYVGLINTDPGWSPAAQRMDLDGDTAVSTYGDVFSMYVGMIGQICNGGTQPPPPRPGWAPAVLMAIDPDSAGNDATTLARTEACVRIDVDPADFDDGVADHSIDVFVKGDTQAPTTYDAWFYYKKPGAVDPVSWNDTIKLPLADAFTNDIEPVSRFNAGAAYLSGGPGTAGDGTIVRVDLDVIGPGLASFEFAFARNAYWSVAGAHELTTMSSPLALAINTNCNTDRALELVGATAVGDDTSDPSDDDDDGDGFSDVIEVYLGTEPLDNCPNWPPGPGGDAWPLDMNSDTYLTVGGDVLPYRDRIGAWGGPPADPNWLQRLDTNMDNYLTVGGDVLPFRGRLGEQCT